jgi:hypothetical protein
VILIAGLVGLVVGCGGSTPSDRHPISGSVTLDGVPLPAGSISFQPLTPTGTRTGAAISGGVYSIDAAHGLPSGKYRVAISSAAPQATSSQGIASPGGTRAVPVELIPPEYNVKSDKTIEVGASGPFVYDFHILSKKK